MIDADTIFWPRHNSVELARVRELRGAGKGYFSIARETGVPIATVRDWCLKHGTAPNGPDIGPVPVARRKVRQ